MTRAICEDARAVFGELTKQPRDRASDWVIEHLKVCDDCWEIWADFAAAQEPPLAAKDDRPATVTERSVTLPPDVQGYSPPTGGAACMTPVDANSYAGPSAGPSQRGKPLEVIGYQLAVFATSAELLTNGEVHIGLEGDDDLFKYTAIYLVRGEDIVGHARFERPPRGGPFMATLVLQWDLQGKKAKYDVEDLLLKHDHVCLFKAETEVALPKMADKYKLRHTGEWHTVSMQLLPMPKQGGKIRVRVTAGEDLRGQAVLFRHDGAIMGVAPFREKPTDSDIYVSETDVFFPTGTDWADFVTNCGGEFQNLVNPEPVTLPTGGLGDLTSNQLEDLVETIGGWECSVIDDPVP